LKNKNTWRNALVDLKIPNKIQPQEYSRGSGTDNALHISPLVTPPSTAITMSAT